jgi:hypothetical protein
MKVAKERGRDLGSVRLIILCKLLCVKLQESGREKITYIRSGLGLICIYTGGGDWRARLVWMESKGLHTHSNASSCLLS